MKISRSVGLKVLCGGRLRSELYRMETGFIVLVSISVYDWLKGMGDDYGVNVCFGSVSYGGVRLLGFGVGIEEDDDLDDITDIFKIEGNLFDFETPLCEAFNDFNYLLKIDKDLFSFDIQGTRTYEEYELNNPMTRDLEELWLDNGVPYQLCDHICKLYRFKNGVTKRPTCSLDIDGFCNGGELPRMVRVGSMIYFQDYKWYDELADGKLKDETLMHKEKIEESWGNATPGVMKFCAWLINNFRNFHELDYNDNQVNEECRDDPTHEPSVCKIRRFEMMKYSLNADEEYIAIKESEYLNYSKNNLDAYQQLLHIINEEWVVATPDDE
ncbi:hypothetical protein Tco_0393957 [Tanacetum coccineum]